MRAGSWQWGILDLFLQEREDEFDGQSHLPELGIAHSPLVTSDSKCLEKTGETKGLLIHCLEGKKLVAQSPFCTCVSTNSVFYLGLLANDWLRPNVLKAVTGMPSSSVHTAFHGTNKAEALLDAQCDFWLSSTAGSSGLV